MQNTIICAWERERRSVEGFALILQELKLNDNTLEHRMALLVEGILDKLLTYILSVSKHVLQWSKHRETEYLNKLGLSCAKLSQA